MRLRGPGDMLGTRQSGNLDLRVADLIQDLKVLEEAKQVAADIIATDPHLERAENVRLRSLLRGKREGDAWLPVT